MLKELLMISDIKDIISQFKNGAMIILIDDEDRENEGDLVISSKNLTPEHINFMITHAKGLVCAPISSEIASNLKLSLMEGVNNEMETQFTASVDLKGEGVTTGISAEDRYKTIIGLTNKDATRENFSIPGHIFPLQSMDGGVLRRAGHTEAAVDFEAQGWRTEDMIHRASLMPKSKRLRGVVKSSLCARSLASAMSSADALALFTKVGSAPSSSNNFTANGGDLCHTCIGYKYECCSFSHRPHARIKGLSQRPLRIKVIDKECSNTDEYQQADRREYNWCLNGFHL